MNFEFWNRKDVVSLGGRELEDLAFNALAATSSFCDNNHTQKKAFDGDNTTFGMRTIMLIRNGYVRI